jgi:hypothetical protein
MYDLHNAYNYENIVFIYYVQFSIRVSFACEFISFWLWLYAHRRRSILGTAGHSILTPAQVVAAAVHSGPVTMTRNSVHTTYTVRRHGLASTHNAILPLSEHKV